MATEWKRGDNLKEPCKLCGGILVIRQSSRDGGLFVGCRSFPSCKFNRPIRPGDEREGGQWGEDSGYLCAECQKPQRNTPSGLTCKNGHGGAGSIDPSTGEVVDRGFDDLMPDGLEDEEDDDRDPFEDDPDPFETNGGPEPAQTMELASAVDQGAPTVEMKAADDLDERVRDQHVEEGRAMTGFKGEDFVEGFQKHGVVGVTSVPSFEQTYETADRMLVFNVELRGVGDDGDKVYSSAEATFAFDLDATKRRMAAGTDSPVEIVGKMLTYLVRSVKAVLLK